MSALTLADQLWDVITNVTGYYDQVAFNAQSFNNDNSLFPMVPVYVPTGERILPVGYYAVWFRVLEPASPPVYAMIQPYPAQSGWTGEVHHWDPDKATSPLSSLNSVGCGIGDYNLAGHTCEHIAFKLMGWGETP